MKSNLSNLYRWFISFFLALVLVTTAAFSTPAPAQSADEYQYRLEAKPKPTIRITSIPPYGSNSDLRGLVTGVDPSKYQVAVYIKVRGGWWTKPYWAQPITYLYSNGYWVCDVTTGKNDRYASDYAAYLIPRSYKPPLMYGGSNLPAVLKKNAVAKVVVHRSVKK